MAEPSTAETLRVSTPGRICLFGEHQDYLHLPVIAAAISLRITINKDSHAVRHGRIVSASTPDRPRNDPPQADGVTDDVGTVRIRMPDVNSEDSFSLGKNSEPIPYVHDRDYLRSAVNILKRKGYTFPHGFDCTVHGEIPIGGGVSSSSAFVVAWIGFLAWASDRNENLSADLCAQYAVEAEVNEFSEPGGMMDQYASALGGLLAMDFHPGFAAERLSAKLGAFVLGESGEPKNTTFVLANVKNRVLDIVKQLTARDPNFSLHTATPESIQSKKGELDAASFALLEGTVKNHFITREARELCRTSAVNNLRLGKLLLDHQQVLRDVLHISTPKIDRMLDAAMTAGALGGKITGSGGGGCMFAYAPEHTEEVAEAITRAGGRAYVVRVSEGLRVETR
ncbi:MAG TPA: galactokinase family protein [Bacteroidota bacterium]|nr:galactokinase family protein [Bacteroidota bacterium]